MAGGVSAGTVDRVLHNRGNVSEPARLAVEKFWKSKLQAQHSRFRSLLKEEIQNCGRYPEASHGEYWESIHNGIRHAIEEYET